MKKYLDVRICVLVAIVLLTNLSGCSQAAEKNNKHYLYYLHGRIIEDLGADNAVSEEFGKYEYKQILKAFADNDFEVVSEARPKDTDVENYASKLAKEINQQIKNGVSPEKITVVGASKGSLIAMLASTKLANKEVKFVIIGNCNEYVQKNFDINLYGRVLSIFERSDTVGGNSCERIKTGSTGISEYKEIELNTSFDHGYLYKPLKEWVDPAIEWAKK